MGNTRSRAIYSSSYNLNFDRIFQIPEGFPAPLTVGHDAIDAYGPAGSTGPNAGPIARTDLVNYQDRSNLVYTATNGMTVDGGLFYGVEFHPNVSMYRCSVEGLSSPKLIYFYIYENVPAGGASSGATSIKLAPGPDFNQYVAGISYGNNISDEPADTLVNVSVTGHATNDVEKGYLGRQQNSDGSVDFSTYYNPTGPFNDGNGDYYIFDFANKDPSYGLIDPYIGLFFFHGAGATINAQPATGGVSAADFTDPGSNNTPGYVLAQWTTFGYANTNGGGSGAIGSAGDSRFANCFIGNATDGPRVSGNLGFKDCVMGPELGGISGAKPHSDGFQNVGGAHNDPTGDIWLDFSNQQTNSGNGAYSQTGYPNPTWSSGHSYHTGDRVTALVMIDTVLTPVIALSKSDHIAAATYALDRSNWTETISSLDLLHLPGQSWSWTKHCSMLAFESTGLDTYSFSQNHSPYFLSSSSNNAGPIQNFLVWNCYLSGGQSTIIDNTDVNTDNWNLPKNGNKMGPGTRGIGGVNGMIVAGGCVAQFALSAKGSQIGLIAQGAPAYDPQATNGNNLVLYTGCFIADGTNFTVGSGQSKDQAQANGDAIYSSSTGYYTVNILAPLGNAHVYPDTLTTASNGNGGVQQLPNLSAATNADSKNVGPMLANTGYKYALVNPVMPQANTTRVVLNSTYTIAFGTGINSQNDVNNNNNNTDPTMVTFGPMPSAGRTDAAVVTLGSTTVADNSVSAWDIGKPVVGTGIPAGATVATVNPTTKTFQLLAAATASGSSVQIGGAQLTFGAEVVTVINQVNTDSNGLYTVDIFPALQNMHSASTTTTTSPNSQGIAMRTTTPIVYSSETRWRELPRSVELSGDLSGLDLTYNYWGTVTDQNGNLITLIDAMRNSSSGGWNGWPRAGQRAGEWENTSL